MHPEADAIAVVQDVYHMKGMSLEVVTQLGRDCITAEPEDDALRTAVQAQVRDEFAHMDACRRYLSERGTLGRVPAFVKGYTAQMRRLGASPHRTLGLVVATVACTSVEKLGLGQLTVASQASGSQTEPARALFTRLHHDEREHFRLVATDLAPRVARRAGVREKALACLTAVGIGRIATLRWWPRSVHHYEACGLDFRHFVGEVSADLARVLPPLGVPFPERAFRRLTLVAAGRG
jgi:hypothetical protein